MSNNVLVFAEQRNGVLKRVAFEMLGLGAELAAALGSQVEAVLLGASVDSLPDTLAQYGATRVYVADDPALAVYSSEGYANTLAALIGKVEPGVILIGATAMGKDLAPRLAARLGVGLAPDCTTLAVADGRLVATRPIYAGKALARVRLTGDPQIVTVRPNVLPAPEPDVAKTATVEPVDVAAGDVRARVVEVLAAGEGEIDVAEATVIVAGGRGLGGPEGFDLIRRLARTLNAAVGASRAAVDAGWIDHAHQVGQTGKTVTPDLYIACGISGAIQHLAGMKTAKCIVAVNKDAEAPIFNTADYGIVGDLNVVLPLLDQECQALLAE
ncbi:MAG: electron transfer flavoprotein subunit alpha/FixB family protein [Chloroflexi bacterium]|nr:electron transfer flavoprotein subunit alpha/FixB family protein [Chloroflexota bacterium]MBU1749326.1 electron transfer flavoprotein subunit alpha/FixB family protein [Chloroflexota bacterium]